MESPKLSSSLDISVTYKNLLIPVFQFFPCHPGSLAIPILLCLEFIPHAFFTLSYTYFTEDSASGMERKTPGRFSLGSSFRSVGPNLRRSDVLVVPICILSATTDVIRCIPDNRNSRRLIPYRLRLDIHRTLYSVVVTLKLTRCCRRSIKKMPQ